MKEKRTTREQSTEQSKGSSWPVVRPFTISHGEEIDPSAAKVHGVVDRALCCAPLLPPFSTGAACLSRGLE